MKHLLKMADLTKEEIISILDLADQLKYEKQHDISHKILDGKTLGLIFQKPSTRTRVSFETGAYQLGIQPLFLSTEDLQIGRGEPVQDTARTLSRYLDCIVLRTFGQNRLESLANHSSIPVISGMTDYAHPCQVLADLMTIRERYIVLDGLKIAYIGDGDNVCNSLIVGCLKMGMKVSVATPEAYKPDEGVLEYAKGFENFEWTTNPKQAVKDADVVFTDTWVSMGKEAARQQRLKAFQGFQVNAQLMSLAKETAMVQHCLPAYRDEEITDEIFEKHADEIFDEAENRLHVQKAVLALLLKDE